MTTNKNTAAKTTAKTTAKKATVKKALTPEQIEAQAEKKRIAKERSKARRMEINRRKAERRQLRDMIFEAVTDDDMEENVRELTLSTARDKLRKLEAEEKASESRKGQKVAYTFDEGSTDENGITTYKNVEDMYHLGRLLKVVRTINEKRTVVNLYVSLGDMNFTTWLYFGDAGASDPLIDTLARTTESDLIAAAKLAYNRIVKRAEKTEADNA